MENRSATKILVIDDDPKLTQQLHRSLSGDGHEVQVVRDARDGLRHAYAFQPGLVLLDILMPGVNGWDLLRRMRELSDVPVIILSAIDNEDDKVRGFDLGADDYVTKPFSPRALVARVRAVLRRAQGGPTLPDVLRGGDVVLDREAHQVTVGGQEVDLTPTEFDLLKVLMTTPGRVFTRAELIDRVLGDEADVFERTIDAHVKNLRQKIEPHPSRPCAILTVRGAGYKFSEDADAG